MIPRNRDRVTDDWTEEDRSWLTALIDGKGCIGIHKHVTAGCILRVAIGMTDETIIRRIHEVAGVGRVSLERRATRDLWRWSVECEKALDLLKRVRPYLVRKKENVHIAEALYKHGITRGSKKAGTPPEVMKVRWACYEAMKRLNRRGVAAFRSV